MHILLGTRNRSKIKELKQILSHQTHIIWLTYDDVAFSDVVEDGATFRENALKKAHQISSECQCAVLAEDSGLVVDALGGDPGVRTARYAGENASNNENIRKLLTALETIDMRHARFVCCAVLVVPNQGEWVSEGLLNGTITRSPQGERGFGYDPVFMPEGYSETLAELGEHEKNAISHRRRAIEGLEPVLTKLASLV